MQLQIKPALKKLLLPLSIAACGALIIFLLYNLYPVIFVKPLDLPPGKDFDANVTVKKDPIHIGDIIPVILEIKGRSDTDCRMPEYIQADILPLLIKEKSKVERIRLRGGWAKRVRYLLTSWDTGSFTLPALTFTGDGSSEIYTVPEKEIIISSVLPKGRTKEELLALPLKGPKGPVAFPPDYQILIWLVVILFVLVFIALVLKIIKKIIPSRVNPVPVEEVVIEPAHIIAFRRLDRLKNTDYLEKGDFDGFYSELSECVREYMENRFQIRALEMTTEEFIIHLSKDARLKGEYHVLLKEFLKSSDLVKFAKFLPAVHEAENALALIYKLVEQTMAQEDTKTTDSDQSSMSNEQLSGTVEQPTMIKR